MEWGDTIFFRILGKYQLRLKFHKYSNPEPIQISFSNGQKMNALRPPAKNPTEQADISIIMDLPTTIMFSTLTWPTIHYARLTKKYCAPPQTEKWLMDVEIRAGEMKRSKGEFQIVRNEQT